MIRVFIVDDHAVVRSGLQLVLEATDEMVVVGTAADGGQALRDEAVATCDVLLLDLSLPRMNGDEVLRRLLKRRPDLRIVVLSMYPEDQYALHLLREGAAAYLSKDRPTEELIAAVRKVAGGGSYVTDTLAEQALSGAARAPDSAPPHARLSARERQVFQLLIQGRSVSDIAAETDLHMSTVSNYVRHIKDKLHVRSLAEILSYAHRMGLTT